MSTFDKVLLVFMALLILKGVLHELVNRRPMLGAAVLLGVLAWLHPVVALRLLDAVLPLAIVGFGLWLVMKPHLPGRAE